jgi:hypothetical protein
MTFSLGMDGYQNTELARWASKSLCGWWMKIECSKKAWMDKVDEWMRLFKRKIPLHTHNSSGNLVVALKFDRSEEHSP